ncbi:Uncharacterized protein APZ42_013817 [Daphnia magna]|uniref:Uncharacterized protein n=2 Tax=Daphnia magna TaxID=35525 RepID=A0ABQ9YRX3_9CRUS|nr:hypothetical protein OUZ56_005134 [Daphnia magna]KZS19649.1 Uncharacterized protein APZ42_013817 [Daphnia magna]
MPLLDVGSSGDPQSSAKTKTRKMGEEVRKTTQRRVSSDYWSDISQSILNRNLYAKTNLEK